MPKLVLGFSLELPDALSAEVHALSDLLERLFLSAQKTESIPDDVELALVQAAERPLHDRPHLTVVDFLFLILGRGIGEETRESAFFVPIHVIVYRELFLQQWEDHLVSPKTSLAHPILQRACRVQRRCPLTAAHEPQREIS
jgi:hypothetical protein